MIWIVLIIIIALIPFGLLVAAFKTIILKTAFVSTKDTKKHEKLDHYSKTEIHQTGW